VEAALLYLQGAFFDSLNGSIRLGSASAATILDASL